MRATDVVVHTPSAEVRTGDAVVNHFLGFCVPNPLGPDEEDSALVEQGLVLLNPIEEEADLGSGPLGEAVRESALDATDPRDVLWHPRATQFLE